MEFVLKAFEMMENKDVESALHLIKDKLPNATDDDKFSIIEFYMHWGFLSEASDIIAELMKKYPHEGELKVMLSHIYIEQEKDELAIQLLSEIDENDDAYLSSLLQLADVYHAQGLFEVAEEKLLKAKQLAPNEDIIDFALGELFFSIGDYYRAIIYYEKVKSEIPDGSISGRLAESFASIGDYEKALTYYQQIEADDVDTLFKFGLTAYYADEIDTAIATWKQVVQKDPFYHTAYYWLAKAYEHENMLQEAYQTAQNGLHVDEYYKELYYLTAGIARKLNNIRESKEMLQSAIKLDADYKEAILLLVEILKDEQNFTEISELLEEVMKNGSSDPLYNWELARTYNELERYVDALNQYNKAYNNLQHDSEFLREYGYFLSEEGRNQEAIAIFEKYLTIVPNDIEIVEFNERLLEK